MRCSDLRGRPAADGLVPVGRRHADAAGRSPRSAPATPTSSSAWPRASRRTSPPGCAWARSIWRCCSISARRRERLLPACMLVALLEDPLHVAIPENHPLARKRAAHARRPARPGLGADVGHEPMRTPRRALLPSRRIRAPRHLRVRRLRDRPGPGRRRASGSRSFPRLALTRVRPGIVVRELAPSSPTRARSWRRRCRAPVRPRRPSRCCSSSQSWPNATRMRSARPARRPPGHERRWVPTNVGIPTSTGGFTLLPC